MKDLIKVEIELPVLPTGYEYTGEYRRAELGDGYMIPSEPNLVHDWPSFTPSVYAYPIIKKTIKTIDPFDSSDDIDLEFSNDGGRWYCLPRAEAGKLTRSNKYLFSNLGNLSFSMCRIRQNHRFVRVEGTKLPEGLSCWVRNSHTRGSQGWTSSGAPCGDYRVNIEVLGSAEGYKYEWE